MRAEIIAVGTELLSFGRAETNSLFVASRLLPLGFSIPRKFVVADSEDEIAATLELALKFSDVVLISGGLGPTADDLTREAVARCLGVGLQEDPSIIEQLQARYRRFGLRMKENSRKQAEVPQGAEVIPNPLGTAPGLLIRKGRQFLFLLPGPPRELNPMVDDFVLPVIRQELGVRPAPFRCLKIAGEAESQVDARVAPIYRGYSEVETTILSSPGIISLYFVWRGVADPGLANEVLGDLADAVRKEMGKSVYAEQDETLSQILGCLLRENRLTIAVAESCTGGLIGKLISDVPGSSEYFLGGAITYSNESKAGLLGVDPALIGTHGAVSGVVAEAMAEGIRTRLGASIGLSATGIAGPGGGSEDKPVGTAFLGFSNGSVVRSRRLALPGDREAIRARTAQLALDLVRRELL